MEYLAFRNLVGVSHTEAEVATIAEEVRLCVGIEGGKVLPKSEKIPELGGRVG